MKGERVVKALFIGGTGNISSYISALAVERGVELYLLNRGNRTAQVPQGAHMIQADINDEEAVRRLIGGMTFDVVANFIAFRTDEIERDWRLFRGKTAQYIFISSASAYQKPLSSPFITESTPLANPFWEYSRNKIVCEELLMGKYRAEGFPITIVRPSHTYGDALIPFAVQGNKGCFSVLERIRTGKKVIVQGDGSSLWMVTHSADFAKAFVGLMGNIHAVGEAYHITSDENITWNQIYEVVGAALGRRPEIVHIPSDALAALNPKFVGGLLGDKTHTVIFDNTKVKKAVPEFAATMRFDQGARKSIDYIYSHPECQQADPEFDEWCDRVIKIYEDALATMPKYE